MSNNLQWIPELDDGQYYFGDRVYSFDLNVTKWKSST